MLLNIVLLDIMDNFKGKELFNILNNYNKWLN